MPITESMRFTSGHCVATVWPMCGHCVATVWPLGVCHAPWEINAPTLEETKGPNLCHGRTRGRARAGEQALDLKRNTSQSDQTGKSSLLKSNMAVKAREFVLTILS